MSDTNGAAAPNDPALSDEAIDAAIDTENDGPIAGDETHKLAQELAELKQQLRAKDEVIARRDRDLDDIKKTSRQQSEMLSELVGNFREARIEAKNSGYWYERERLEAIQRQATTEADVAKFDAAASALRALEQQRAAAEQKPPTSTKQADTTAAEKKDDHPQVDPVAAAWVADNPWVRDTKMWREAYAIELNLHEEKPHLSTADRLKEVKAEMMKRHPAKFGNDARQQPSTVSRPGPQGAGKTKAKAAKTEADLPAEDRAVMEKLVRNKVLTKDQYLKDYQWDK